MKWLRYSAVMVSVAAISCSEPELVHIPEHFPDLPVPADNNLTKEKIELGRWLFYEEALSLDSSVSCASCHLQKLAFSDGRKVSAGVHGALGERNSPALQNLAYYPNFFMDGGIPTLEMQVEAPITTIEEMSFNYFKASKRLNADEQYRKMFNDAFGKEADAYGITRAIAAFERTMVSGGSKYDQFVNGDVELTEEEQQGLELFFSDKAGCSDCHSGFLFTDFSLANIGLYETYADTGYGRISFDTKDHGKFKVPSLRNVAVTAPYFHDGSARSLEQVVAHFDAGGVGHPVQDERVHPLNLTEQDQRALVAFLYTLTDEAFISNPQFSDPSVH